MPIGGNLTAPAPARTSPHWNRPARSEPISVLIHPQRGGHGCLTALAAIAWWLRYCTRVIDHLSWLPTDGSTRRRRDERLRGYSEDGRDEHHRHHGVRSRLCTYRKRPSQQDPVLTCAAIMVGAGIVGSTFYLHEAGIDGDVIFCFGHDDHRQRVWHTTSSNTSRFGSSNARTPRRCASHVIPAGTGDRASGPGAITSLLLIAPVTLLVCDRLGSIPRLLFGGRSLLCPDKSRRATLVGPAEYHRQPGGTDVQRLPDPAVGLPS